MEYIRYILNLFLVIPIVLLLFFIAIKLSKASFLKMGIYNHVSILEKINIGKDSSAIVLKSGEEGYVGILTSSGFQTIQKLDKEELKKIESKKNQFLNQKNSEKLNFKFLKEKLNLIKRKIKEI